MTFSLTISLRIQGYSFLQSLLVLLHAPILGLLGGVAFWEHDIPSEHCLAPFHLLCFVYTYSSSIWRRSLASAHGRSEGRIDLSSAFFLPSDTLYSNQYQLWIVLSLFFQQR